jgi:hypothetical protein
MAGLLKVALRKSAGDDYIHGRNQHNGASFERLENSQWMP